jgi:quinohemoprotein ethanol dehydrogenase
MATGGNVVFQGTVDGAFSAYSATTGKRLWSFAAQAPLLAAPISYAVKGRQYVTLLTGLGTLSGLVEGEGMEKYGIDPRSQARRVLTFALDGKLQLPPSAQSKSSAIEDPGFNADARGAEVGQAIYNPRCAACHGSSVVGSIHAPDLRRSAVPLSAQAFASVVRDGALVPEGMPAFGELTDQQLGDLRQYIRTEADALRDKAEYKGARH